jgi:hypothetical protein
MFAGTVEHTCANSLLENTKYQAVRLYGCGTAEEFHPFFLNDVEF